ncbi:HD-GYP domain-containing protein [Syntrophomonas palmitatica]|uniref:HD-GYP domain-containing protein n=1 Tax=Syntrophomonas palmitatica TaxID=402877 RepID=UPI0006CFE5EB|nr:HD domain-containing phosphohydrolase [Syntrophomonas palmitatica]
MTKRKKSLNITGPVSEQMKCIQNLIYNYDVDTYYHCQKVAQNSVMIGQIIGLSRKRILLIYNAALIHDLGKIKLPIEVFRKKEGLTDEEWGLVKQHPQIGTDLINSLNDSSLETTIPVVLYHHEHMDGSGYPFALQGEQIPFDARIVAIADALDAMMSPRPFRDDIYSIGRALLKLINYCGTQFDEEIVHQVITWYKGKPLY